MSLMNAVAGFLGVGSPTAEDRNSSERSEAGERSREERKRRERKKRVKRQDFDSAVSLVDTVADIQTDRKLGVTVVMDTEGAVWGVYRMANITYDLLTASAKEKIFRNFVSCIEMVSGRMKILALVKEFDTNSYLARMAEEPKSRMRGRPEMYARWLDFRDDVAHTLQSRQPHERTIYLCKQLDVGESGGGGLLDSGLAAVERTARRGSGIRPYTRAELRALFEEAHRIKRIFASLLPADSYLSPGQVKQLFARAPFRSIGEPPEEQYVEDIYRHRTLGVSASGEQAVRYHPPRSYFRNVIGDVPWTAHYDHLEFAHGEGRMSYQQVLKIATMPTGGLFFPGWEWAFSNRPVDICLDCDIVPPEVAEAKRRTKWLDLKGQTAHTSQGGGEVPMDLHEAGQSLTELKSMLDSNKPMISMNASFAVSANTRKALAIETDKIMMEYRKLYHIELSMPRCSQAEAFADMLPVGARKNDHYAIQMAPETVAGSMPVGDAALGDGGAYLGYTRQTGSLVGLDIETPIRDLSNNKSAAMGITGTLGAGKTNAAQLIASREIIRGHQVLAVDPKGDWDKVKALPELSGAVNVLRISRTSDTRIPILRVYPPDEVEEIYQLVLDTITEVLGVRGNRDYIDTIQIACGEFMKRFVHADGDITIHEMVDCFHWVEKNETVTVLREAASRLARSLKIRMEHPLGRVIFTEEERDESFTREWQEYPFTVIDTAGLMLPDQDTAPDDMTDQQRISHSILSVVAATTNRIAKSNRYATHKQFKLIFFDEAWRFFSNALGAQVCKFLAREGRSLYVAPVFLSQLWRDFPQEIKELLRYKFIGRSDSEPDIRLAFKDLGIEVGEELISLVKNDFTSGHFVFQDATGQTGPCYIDPVTPERLHALNTGVEQEG